MCLQVSVCRSDAPKVVMMDVLSPPRDGMPTGTWTVWLPVHSAAAVRATATAEDAVSELDGDAWATVLRVEAVVEEGQTNSHRLPGDMASLAVVTVHGRRQDANRPVLHLDTDWLPESSAALVKYVGISAATLSSLPREMPALEVLGISSCVGLAADFLPVSMPRLHRLEASGCVLAAGWLSETVASGLVTLVLDCSDIQQELPPNMKALRTLSVSNSVSQSRKLYLPDSSSINLRLLIVGYTDVCALDFVGQTESLQCLVVRTARLVDLVDLGEQWLASAMKAVEGADEMHDEEMLLAFQFKPPVAMPLIDALSSGVRECIAVRDSTVAELQQRFL